jgi:hypothetical protein
MVASRLDVLMMWRGLWLSLAYVTGRAVQFSEPMRNVAGFVRDGLCSGAQVLVLVLVVWWWWSWGRELPTLPAWVPRRSRKTAPQPVA